MPRKKLESLVYTTPSNKPLKFVNPVIYTGKPTKMSVTLTYIQEANIMNGPLGWGLLNTCGLR